MSFKRWIKMEKYIIPQSNIKDLPNNWEVRKPCATSHILVVCDDWLENLRSRFEGNRLKKHAVLLEDESFSTKMIWDSFKNYSPSKNASLVLLSIFNFHSIIYLLER